MRSAADFVFGAPKGRVVALAGIDSESLRALIDEAEPSGRRVLFARIVPAATAEAIAEQVINLLAETVRRLWPVWFTDVRFGDCRNDPLGQCAAKAIIRRAAEKIPGLSASWAVAAAGLVLGNRPPRVLDTPPAVELTQLALAFSRCGLVLVLDADGAIRLGANPAAAVRALEWIAQNSQVAVVALFAKLPANEPPFDRILYGARQVVQVAGAIAPDPAEAAGAEPWIAPWRGLPHPLSDIEQRLAQALGADVELAPLFRFNQFVATVLGSRPKVDLVWAQGHLVVELDGYGSHGNRTAFIYDRHRDYELTLSGYTVLRLANDEIAQDCGKAIEKIRNLVRLRRKQIPQGG